MTFACEDLFKKLAAELPSKGADVVKEVGAIYRFDVKSGGTTRSWIVDLKNGSGSCKEDANGKGDCTIQMADADFVDLMTGKLDGQSAFMGGQLKIKGDMMLAMKLEALSALAQQSM
jgi:putative sterol carrier protein